VISSVVGKENPLHDHIFHFTDIPLPLPADQMNASINSGENRFMWFVEFGAVFLQQMVGNQRYVLHPIAQCRQADRQNI
jgi:hypothetical protein